MKNYTPSWAGHIPQEEWHDVFDRAVEELPAKDKQIVGLAAGTLESTIRGMGEQGAREAVARLGLFILAMETVGEDAKWLAITEGERPPSLEKLLEMSEKKKKVSARPVMD